MKKVLYLGGFELPDKNAAAQRVLANARLLRDMGFEVSFIGISKDMHNAPHYIEGFKSNPVPYPTSTKDWIYQIFTFISFRQILDYRPDYVVLYNFPSFASLKILRHCHRKGIKVIHDITEWESNSKWSPSDIMRRIDINLRMRYCVKKMDGVIAISRFLYEYYCRFTNTIQVPPTVDLSNPKFCRDRVLCKKDGSVKIVYAGSAGNVATKDKLDTIIESLNKYPSIHLDVVGLTEEQFCLLFGWHSEINDNIKFHGRVSHLEAVQAVCNADFQLLIRDNSLKNKAGFPTKLVESFSCCTPIIATVSSNICDYLEDNVNGFVISGKQSLDDVLNRVIEMTSEDISKMKRACRDFKGFDYRFYREEFSKIFI